MLEKSSINTVRKKAIIAMRKEGLSYAKIGQRLGISYERVRQILNNTTEGKLKNTLISPPLRTSEVANLLNIHVNTVRRWSKQGILRAYRIGPRGDRRFDREEVARLFPKYAITNRSTY